MARIPYSRWRARLLATGLTAFLAPRATSQSSAPSRAADLVVFGRVWTGDSARKWAGAVAVIGDRIVEVGDSARVARLVGSSTRVLSNGPAMVVPGFMDGHAHLIQGGLELTRVDLRDAASPQEFISRLKRYAAGLRPGEWITGGRWDHERWAGTPLPERSWIDSVTPNNPVFVKRVDGHVALANSAALREAGITRSTPEIPGGSIVHDRAGYPTGLLKDQAKDLVEAVIPIPTDLQSDSAIARALSWAASKGVTAVADMSVPWYELSALERARTRGALTARVSVFVLLAGWRRMADRVRADGVGDQWLRVAGVKAYVDGSLGAGTALFYQPYSDAPQTTGLMVSPEDSLRAWIGAADSAGLQVAAHAIGERPNGLILDIYDSLAKAHGPRDRRFRIEHAQHLRPQDVERVARSGVIASMQPYHLIADGRWAEKRVGPERVKRMYVFRSLLDRHAHLAFGSDWSVAPLDPILGIYAAVTRRTLDGKNPQGWIPEQKITVEEALRAYTAGDAYGVFGERTRGKLAPGYVADIVLLDRDLTRTPPEAIARVAVRVTVAGGKIVFQGRP